ncbi:hypothetical protein [Bacillus sp. FJAT-52991]|uniref:Uncharacterized protein n=1 Tax=Bacillus kandeliae TaxID=3129297 RepID=A0ABZ2N5T7_9BACI
MKQLLGYIIIGVSTFLVIWLYNKQLGAIPFICLSLFLFYKAFMELKKPKKDSLNESIK